MKTSQIEPQNKNTSNDNNGRETSTNSILNNSLPSMVFQFITKTDGTLEFTSLSESVMDFYGVSAEDGKLNACAIYEKIQPEDRDRFVKTGFRAFKKGIPFKREVRIINPSGSVRWSCFEAIPTKMQDGNICWDGIEQNITELK